MLFFAQWIGVGLEVLAKLFLADLELPPDGLLADHQAFNVFGRFLQHNTLLAFAR